MMKLSRISFIGIYRYKFFEFNFFLIRSLLNRDHVGDLSSLLIFLLVIYIYIYNFFFRRNYLNIIVVARESRPIDVSGAR